jgi:hypothetical protein
VTKSLAVASVVVLFVLSLQLFSGI